MNEDEGNIYEVLKAYVRAFETADADLMECLFWIDDPHFTEVEDFIAEPFGREPFLDIMDWIRTHPPGGTMKFYKTQVHLLSPEVAYAVSLQEITPPDGDISTSRAALIFLKKENE